MHCSKLILLQQANILHGIVAAMLSGYNAYKLYTAKLPQEGSTRVSCEAAYILMVLNINKTYINTYISNNGIFELCQIPREH